MNKHNSIYNFTIQQLEEKILSLGLKKFNAKQIFNWIYKSNITNFNDMSNISKKNIPLLENEFYFESLQTKKILTDDETGTIKLLFELYDGNFIETVIMRFDYGNSVCISSQVGCNMGCKFCASGLTKKNRDLSTSEIVLQVLQAKIILNTRFNQQLNNVVLMGVGEPLDNFNNVINAINIITNQDAIGIGSRHVTISTCGLINKIPLLAEKLPQINLAISLHAPNNEIRNKIMPINKTYNIEQLIESIEKYLTITNRRISFEYILLDKINDSDSDAFELAKLLKNLLCYVNIIPYNEVKEFHFRKSNRAKEFSQILKQCSIGVTIRLERGLKIDAACGQLRGKYNA